VDAGATPGAVLSCSIRSQLTPTGGTITVPVTVRVVDPALPLVTVDDVTVAAAGPGGTGRPGSTAPPPAPAASAATAP
jgi:hypothetical protein